MKNRLAAVLAHPDDADIWVGGTLLNHRNHGDTIKIFYLFSVSQERQHEAIASASFLNADLVFIEASDSSTKLVDELTAYRPTIIITHWEWDSHHEHAETFSCIFNIINTLAVKHSISFTLYSCDCRNSLGRAGGIFLPTNYVNISQVWEEKTALVSVHHSQTPEYWLNIVEIQNKLHGGVIGVPFAEGFFQVPVLGVLKKGQTLLAGV